MKRLQQPWAFALVALVVLLLLNLVMTKGFFVITVHDGHLFGSLIDILVRATPVFLLSLGMTLVIATGGVDLSVGAVMAIAGATAGALITRPDGCVLNFLNVHGSVPAIVIICLIVGALCGVFNGFLVSRLQFQPIVATLLLMVSGRGVAQLIAGGQILTFDNPAFATLGRGSILAIPMPVWISVAAFLLLAFLVRNTAFGLFTEVTGSNAKAAHIAGVDVKNIKLVVYIVTGICAGLAGLVATSDLQAADANNAGLYLELDAILAVSVGGTSLLGGRFSLLGTLIGALLMQTFTTTILTRGISPEITLVAKAAVVIVVCLMQSFGGKGLIRKKAVAA